MYYLRKNFPKMANFEKFFHKQYITKKPAQLAQTLTLKKDPNEIRPKLP